MGSGKGLNIDLPLIMKCVAVICCAIAVGLNVSATVSYDYPRPSLVSNSMIFATGSFIIILAIFLGWTILKNEVNKMFAAIILICGFLWNAGGGIGVIIYNCDYTIDTLHVVGGILALVGGIVMLADGIHNLGYF